MSGGTEFKCTDCESGPCYYRVTFKNPEPPDVCGYVEDGGLVELVSWERSKGRGKSAK